MGLDGVEIVIRVEERFGIAIEDSEAEKIAMPRDLIDCVMRKVGFIDQAQCLTQKSFHRLRKAMMEELGLKRNQIKPEVLLGTLIPQSERQKQICQVLNHLGINHGIALERPGWLRKGLLALIFGTGLAVWLVLTFRPSASADSLYIFAATSPFGAALVAMVIGGQFLFLATQRYRLEFPAKWHTVGELSRWVMAYCPPSSEPNAGEWSRDKIAAGVREIVIEQLGCEKNYHETAHFVKDLGLG
jgi:acyl carrier protein